MLASDAIKKLQELIEKHGDLEIYVASDWFESIENIEFSDHPENYDNYFEIC